MNINFIDTGFGTRIQHFSTGTDTFLILEDISSKPTTQITMSSERTPEEAARWIQVTLELQKVSKHLYAPSTTECLLLQAEEQLSE